MPTIGPRCHELRIFAPDGRLLRVAGGRGGGPGEVSMLPGLEKLSGDSVVALGRVAGRETVVGPGLPSGACQVASIGSRM